MLQQSTIHYDIRQARKMRCHWNAVNRWEYLLNMTTDRIFAHVVMSLLILICGCSRSASINQAPTLPSKDEKAAPTDLLSNENVEASIAMATDYLSRNVLSDGRFNYQVNMNPSVKLNRKYNMLRHAGTIYAMATQQQRVPNDKVKSTILEAANYLRDKAIGPVEGQEQLLAVWSDPAINGTGDTLQAKLGGAGLGIVALTSVNKIEPGFIPIGDLQAIGRFILFMQQEDGSFYSKYSPTDGFDDWVSLYYPGEAALGLIMLYEQDGDEKWLIAALRALEYLATSRAGEWEAPPDHWALIATARILNCEDPRIENQRKLLVDHAVQICDTIIRDRAISRTAPEPYYGGFSADGRTTPAATRLEGLLAAICFVPTDHDIRPLLEVAIDDGMRFLIRSQVREGEFAGAFPRAIGRIPEITPTMREFNQRSTEIRIDYVQHAVSAMIQFADLKMEPNGPLQ